LSVLILKEASSIDAGLILWWEICVMYMLPVADLSYASLSKQIVFML